MERDEKGYITLLLVVLITFGFLLSGGLMPLIQQTSTSTSRYVLSSPPTLSPHQTLQLANLNFIFSAPPTPLSCDVVSSYPGQVETNVLYAFQPGSNETAKAGGTIKVWYTDETALSLGKGTGTTTGNGDGISPWTTSMILANPLVGDLTALDYGYPYYPALFLTDITDNPTSTTGDAGSSGAIGHIPSLVYGTWKALNAANPPSNNSLPAGADQFASIPSANINRNTGTRGTETGYQAEILWNVNNLGLIAGRTYRAQFVIHDGDRNGDLGIGCTTIQM